MTHPTEPVCIYIYIQVSKTNSATSAVLILPPSWLVRDCLMQVRGPGSADTEVIAGGQPDSTTYSYFGSSSDRFLYTGRQSGFRSHRIRKGIALNAPVSMMRI